MCNARAWPKQCWKSCENGSNIVAYALAITEQNKMLGAVGSKV